MMNKKWWKAAGVRALKTVAQTAVSLIGFSATVGSVLRGQEIDGIRIYID